MSRAGKRLHGAAWTLSLAAILLLALTDTRRPEPRPPAIWLWAWERYDDLRFVNPKTTGVAYLAATVRLETTGVEWLGRRQGMSVPAGTRLLPVVRMEGDRATLDDSERLGLARRLSELARLPDRVGLQLDWDAPRSMRPVYRAVLADVRAALPDSALLSMTALASWCTGDCWLRGLPVDEIVPMPFRMGADDRRVRYDLARHGDFACVECRRAVGLSTDEPWPNLSQRRVYLFHPGPWTPAVWEQAAKRLERSQRDGR